MIKVSVFSTRDIWKYIIKYGFVIIILIIIIAIYKYSKQYFNKTELNANQCISYITEEITSMGNVQMNNLEIKPEEILESEFRMSKAVTSRNGDSISNIEDEKKIENNLENSVENNAENSNNQIDNKAISTEQENEELSEVSTSVKTEGVISKYKDTYNYQKDGIKIKNETNFDLNSMNLTTDISVNNKKIVIFHTHTCESYTPTQANSYQPTGNYRTTDLSHSVVKVGDELQKYLVSYGYNVIHNKTFHDYPAYTGSYGRSLKTVTDILNQNKDADVVIDLHRDAIGDDAYAPKVKIGDEYAAQIMFVIGTNGSGLSHDNWKQNLEFAMKVQKKGNEMYPGLYKTMLLRNARYNQHLAKAATIIEIGATGNTLEECEVSAKYLSKVLAEVMK